MTFWKYTSTGLAWLLTRPAHSAAMPEWMETTYSNALDSMNTRLMTPSIGIGRLSIKWSRSQARGLHVAFGDGPRHFEPWSSDVDDTSVGTTSPTTTPHQREDVSALDRFNVHRCPTWWVFSGTGIELVTRQATIRYLYHSATAATASC
ncbi:uncharacterized protein TNCV_2767151 [Trichonephila clavipes]|nr:uncharacterized protein TNCV_2767151 [Trichonephila clavipes]